MLKEIMIDADKLLSKLDLNTVVVYSSQDNNCCISCHTDDDLAYVYVKSKNDGYVEKEFALRNWKTMHSILSSFYSPESFNDLKFKIGYDSENYPNKLDIKNGRLKMTHYLQTYSLIRNQDEMLDSYKKKKLALNQFNSSLSGDEIDDNVIKDIAKMSSLVNEKSFRINYKEGLGTYIYFGDENQSADNGSIIIDENETSNVYKSDIHFPVDYFIGVYKALSGDGFKIKFYSDKIVMVNEGDITSKVAIIRGKHY